MESTNEIINISKITEGFFLGDRITATIDDVIDKFKISHIVNAAGMEIHNEFDTTTMQYLTLNWNETPKQSLFNSKDEIASKIVVFIDKGIKKGEGVLVHSVKGQNRACVVVLIYCMKKYGWSLRKSIDYIGSKKHDVDIPIYFLNQLAQFEGRLGITEKPTIRSETWSVDGVKDDDEMIMRNTYVNGLSVKEIQMKYGRIGGVGVKSLVLKNRKRVGWGDEKGKNGLVRVEVERDLVAIGKKGNVKAVDVHVRLVPVKSAMKGRKGMRKVNTGGKKSKKEKEREVVVNESNEGDNEEEEDDNFSLDKLTFGVDKDLMERLNGYIGINNDNSNNKESEGNVNFSYNNFISTHKKPPKQYITNPMLNNNNNHLAITSTKYIKHHNAVKPHPTFIQLNNTSPSTPKILYKREEIKSNTNPSSHNNNNNSRQLRSSSSDKSSSFSFTNIHKQPPHYRQFSLSNKDTPNNNNNNPIPSSNPKFSLNNVTYFSRSSTNDKSLPSNHSFTSLNFKQSTSKNEFIKRAIKTASRKPHSNSLNYKHANFLDISNSNTNTSINHSLLNDIKYQQYNNFIISDSNSAKNLCKLILY